MLTHRDSEGPKLARIELRLTEAEKRMLRSVSRARGCSMSQLLLEAALPSAVKKTRTQER